MSESTINPPERLRRAGIRAWLIFAASVLFNVAATIFLKYSATELQPDFAHNKPLNFAVLKFYCAAIICLVAQAVFWGMTLRRFKLSFIYPLTSLRNIGLLAGALLFFGENLTPGNIAGTLIISVGAFLVVVK